MVKTKDISVNVDMNEAITLSAVVISSRRDVEIQAW